MGHNVQILMGIILRLLITLILCHVLNGKQATNSVFQRIIADTYHHTYLFACCYSGKYLSRRIAEN